MARPIDADKLIVELYQDQPMDWTGSDAEVQELNDWKLFRNMVDNAPTIDAVPVVRCKDCKHWHKDTVFCGYMSYDEASERVNWYADDFCSYGERKDGDADA